MLNIRNISALFMVLAFAISAESKNEKVVVCHVPDRHYDRPLLLKLSEGAVEHHFKHGDCLCGDIENCAVTACVSLCANPPPECTNNNECISGICEEGFCQLPRCDDEKQNGDETGVDCGGSNCEPCKQSECVSDSQCEESEKCVDGKCEPVPPECTADSQCQVNETCVEGKCEPVPPECTTDSQCQANETCVEGKCEPVPPECLVHEDCESLVCFDGVCQPPRCDDHVQNGDEEGLNCGGSCPNPCVVCGNGIREGLEECDDGNTSNADYCLNDCKSASCQDEEMNQDETGIDCGGDRCLKCSVGQGCEDKQDCKSNVCINGICADGPTCNDKKKNGLETGVDCGGGVCAACPVNTQCLSNSDCSSANCNKGICGPPCYDGLECPKKNQQLENKDPSNLLPILLLLLATLLLRRSKDV